MDKKGYTNFMQMYLLSRKRCVRLHKVLTGLLNDYVEPCSSVRQAYLSYYSS